MSRTLERMISLPAALIVAHPGHELRLYRWLEIVRPHVFVLTDGSGSGPSRIGSTLELLHDVGSMAGPVSSLFTDREIYRLMLNDDVDPIVAATLEITDSIVEGGIRSVVADAFELYNPIHDLCSVIAALVCERASAATGREVRRYQYAVTEAPSGHGERLELDDDALARKLAAANRYDELRPEVERLIARIGMDALRHESLEPAQPGVALPPLTRKPFYETYGEKRVAEGHYSTVIRYDVHFRAFAEQLIAAVQAIPVPAVSPA